MANKLPPLKRGTKVAIVCEGDEETGYIYRLKELNVFSRNFAIKPINAGGIDKVFSVYHDTYSKDAYDIVLIFCDTDDEPYEKVKKLLENLKRQYGIKTDEDLFKIVYFGNPCTMQIVLSHKAQLKLQSRLKSHNANHIKKYFGVDEYRATEKQQEKINNSLTADNYRVMKENIDLLGSSWSQKASTNFAELLCHLEDGEPSAIKKWASSVRKVYNV